MSTPVPAQVNLYPKTAMKPLSYFASGAAVDSLTDQWGEYLQRMDLGQKALIVEAIAHKLKGYGFPASAPDFLRDCTTDQLKGTLEGVAHLINQPEPAHNP